MSQVPPQENKASPSFGLSGWGGNTEQKEGGVRGQGCPEKVVGLSLPATTLIHAQR